MRTVSQQERGLLFAHRYNTNKFYFGGIVTFSAGGFRAVNGYPNNFWGWGGEDDALQLRVSAVKLGKQFPKKGTITDLEDMDLSTKLAVLRDHKDWKNNVRIGHVFVCHVLFHVVSMQRCFTVGACPVGDR